MISIINCDCVSYLQHNYLNPSLIFADPPFNIGQKYQGYKDNVTEEQYASFTLAWVEEAWNKLKDGVLAIHGNDYVARQVIKIEDKIELIPISWVNWHYRFGQNSRTNWIDARCHLLLYGKGNYRWNPENVLVESDRVKYGDKRVNDTENGGKRLPGTVWGVPSDGPYWGRIQGNNKERWNNHPNQLPQKYIERIMLAYTNPGDLVVDIFGGSGTTGMVAKKLKRRCILVDISPQNCHSMKERIEKGFIR